MISINSGVKIYTGEEYELKVFDNINLHVEEGEFIAIMGESGSGKSTLLNVIGGLDGLTSGDICIDGYNLSSMNMTKRDLIRKKYISYIFQDFALVSEFTNYENIELALLNQKLTRKQRKQKIDEYAKKLEIKKILSKYPEQVSGGQKQCVAIARALVMGTPILLADEPTGALDFETAKNVMDILLRLHESGKTIIMVTHSSTIAKYADRILSIVDGKIIRRESEWKRKEY